MQQEKRCAIINYWWADGHGAVLTAFALSKLLEQNGYMPTLIKTTIGGMTNEECEKGRNYQFAKRYVKCTTKNYITPQEYRSLNEEYDHFILGSDQVFRLEWLPEEWFYYYIDYTKNIIAVSASFGIDKINNSRSRIKGIGLYLARFNAISLRENDGRQVYENNFGIRKDLETIMDPVFLVSRSIYDEIIPKEISVDTKEFIFVYVLDWNAEIEEFVKLLGERYGVHIIKETSDTVSEEFLYYIKNCKIVVTDSFHGSCFSIIYNKPFYCFYNVMRGISRINTLKEKFGLSDNLFIQYGQKNLWKTDVPQIDYDIVNKIIEEERSRGSKWIINNLKEPKDKKYKLWIIDRMQIKCARIQIKIVGKYRKIKRTIKRI